MICHQIKPHSRGNLSMKNVFVSYLWRKRVVFWFAIDEVSVHGPKMMKQTSTNSSLQKSIQLTLNRENSFPWVFFSNQNDFLRLLIEGNQFPGKYINKGSSTKFP